MSEQTKAAVPCNPNWQPTLRSHQLQPLLLQSLQENRVNCSKPAQVGSDSACSNGLCQQESGKCLHRHAAVPCLTSHDCLQSCFQGGCCRIVLTGKLQSSKRSQQHRRQQQQQQQLSYLLCQQGHNFNLGLSGFFCASDLVSKPQATAWEFVDCSSVEWEASLSQSVRRHELQCCSCMTADCSI